MASSDDGNSTSSRQSRSSKRWNPFHLEAFRRMDDYQLPAFPEEDGVEGLLSDDEGKTLSKPAPTSSSVSGEPEGAATFTPTSSEALGLSDARLNFSSTQHERIVSLTASLVGVCHGKLEPDDNEASLLVFEFKLTDLSALSRISRCEISVWFKSNHTDPLKVLKIAPYGDNILDEAPPDMSLGARREYVWKRVNEQPRGGRTVLKGSILEQQSNVAVASWSLEEDKKEKGGIPSRIRTAVLLQRHDNAPFTSEIEAHVVISSRKSFSSMFSASRRRGELGPQTIEPARGSNDNRGRLGCDENSLNTVDLDKLLRSKNLV
ncbi:hypothetical protein ACJZ2D_015910 [Fusarium nematophilum]